MKVTIYGTGYVGLVTGSCLAELGHEVLCIDINPEKIQQLQQGNIPIYEPGLDTLVNTHYQNHRLQFSTELSAGVSFSQVQIIAVSTPTIEEHGADISHVLAVANTIAEHMTDYQLVINKSTAPPGTCAQIQAAITHNLEQQQKSLHFDIASNPEFLKEGSAIQDFMQPDRIVLGIESQQAKQTLIELYKAYENQCVWLDIPSAELAKYAANAMLATKISFMNELANIADLAGADIEGIKQAMSLDPRIGSHFINPGCGYGGSCFPKDVQALAHYAQQRDYAANLLTAVDAVNENQHHYLARKIQRYFTGELAGKRFALWGLAFKPNTDDMRKAPSITIMEYLWQQGAKVQAYDPIAMPTGADLFAEQVTQQHLTLCENMTQCLADVDGLIIVTEWAEFKAVDLDWLKSQLASTPIFDGRNLFNPKHMTELGFTYFSVGR